MKYPFLFIVYDEDDDYLKGKKEYYVRICPYVFTSAYDGVDEESCVWNKKQWWQINIDWAGTYYRFNTEKEAMKFIQEWWARRNLDKIYKHNPR